MSLPGLRFRLAELQDAAALGEFMSRSFLATYGHCSTPENVARAVEQHYGEQAQRRQIQDPGCWNLIAQIGEQWAGHAQLKFGSEPPPQVRVRPAVELARFYVDTSQHGQGVAQAMMAQTLQAAKTGGGSSIWLSVWQEAAQAIRFYQKEGYEVVGPTIFMVGDDAKDDWVMSRTL